MKSMDFQLEREHIALNDLLKNAGLCDTGGMGKALVGSGAVRVDGVIETRKTAKIRAGQTVQVEDILIHVHGEDELGQE